MAGLVAAGGFVGAGFQAVYTLDAGEESFDAVAEQAFGAVVVHVAEWRFIEDVVSDEAVFDEIVDDLAHKRQLQC